MQSPGFLGNVGVHELHEPGKLLGVGGRKNIVCVCRCHHEGMDDDAVAVLGLANNPKDQIVQLGRGPEQQPSLQGAGGDLDEGIFRDKAQQSCHA